ncbi:MAG: hypothetical protein ACFCUG_00095 [Thiotrichales bacterium]
MNGEWSLIFLKQRLITSGEALINFIPFTVCLTHHERNQKITGHPELAEGFERLALQVPTNFGH